MPKALLEHELRDPLAVIDALLTEQQTLTAVERFSRSFDHDAKPAQSRYYRDLIPLTRPAEGQQYAFEVDLDACSGCKACVTACHNLNGLDDEEAWRDVGMIVGGTLELPVYQHVTTACHHCVEPACMHGCPVKAYDKDPETGIVRHLDDQCIGCQYCVLKCPYDVPKYNAARGIVRKCDMCSSRLADHEAPACVQACPNQAIRITIVDTQDASIAARAGAFLPGAPSPDYTVPTTRYRSMRLNEQAAWEDTAAVTPQPAHTPLTVMLVLTQWSAGLALAALLAPWLVGEAIAASTRLTLGIAAAVICAAGLVVSTCHLGRPLYAFRAVLGLRTSWLSREIVVFGAYAGIVSAAATAMVLGLFDTLSTAMTAIATAATVVGFAGVFCSAMIYVDTRRVFWRLRDTMTKFAMTTLSTGAAGLLVAAMGSAMHAGGDVDAASGHGFVVLIALVALFAMCKIAAEMLLARFASRRGTSAERQSLAVMRGPLRSVTALRLGLGIVAGLLLPLAMLVTTDTHRASSLALAIATLLALVAAELLERYLFFRAVDAPRMPGVAPQSAHHKGPAANLESVAIGGAA